MESYFLESMILIYVFDYYSEQVLGLHSLEFTFTEPVVEGRLSLVPSKRVEQGSSHEVNLHWFVDDGVDHLLFHSSAAAGHFYLFKRN